jgi:hypothetical protein
MKSGIVLIIYQVKEYQSSAPSREDITFHATVVNDVGMASQRW